MERNYVMTVHCTGVIRTLQRILGIIARRRVSMSSCNFIDTGQNGDQQCTITLLASQSEMANLSQMVAKQVEVGQVAYAIKNEAAWPSLIENPWRQTLRATAEYQVLLERKTLATAGS